MMYVYIRVCARAPAAMAADFQITIDLPPSPVNYTHRNVGDPNVIDY